MTDSLGNLIMDEKTQKEIFLPIDINLDQKDALELADFVNKFKDIIYDFGTNGFKITFDEK